MRLFTVIHRGADTTVQEVECESVRVNPWELHPGEKKYCISVPETLKNEVWMGWAFYETEADAYAKANLSLRETFEMKARKSKKEFDEQGFLAAVAAIKVNKL